MSSSKGDTACKAAGAAALVKCVGRKFWLEVLLLCLLVTAGVALPGGYNVPLPYNYNYGINAGSTNFGQQESGNGGNVKGSYFVHLPDGRVQKVDYWADGSGYHATVTFQGTASHPSYGPSHGY
ncbi:Adult-specific rigid cuticular protein 15.5-like 3 [Homarus americanus]|uniref:Adult-specific rigid cuticular protein 15.5-like 3 n=1 Tax=Homarus americanus TaxID=6706 RepID=A0A8J5MNL0_HOMAM|nr:Adult-specific rigid cuticular protein 15.5-like 3 [Homarus americanus]